MMNMAHCVSAITSIVSYIIDLGLESGNELTMTLKERSKVKSDIIFELPPCDFLQVDNTFESCICNSFEDISHF